MGWPARKPTNSATARNTSSNHLRAAKRRQTIKPPRRATKKTACSGPNSGSGKPSQNRLRSKGFATRHKVFIEPKLCASILTQKIQKINLNGAIWDRMHSLEGRKDQHFSHPSFETIRLSKIRPTRTHPLLQLRFSTMRT